MHIQIQSNASSLFIFSVSSSLANFKAADFNLWHFLCHCNTADSDKFSSHAKLKCGDGVLLYFNFILVNFCCIHRCVPGVPRTLNGDQLREIFSTENSWANIFRVAMKDKFKLRLQGKSPTGKPRWEYLGGEFCWFRITSTVLQIGQLKGCKKSVLQFHTLMLKSPALVVSFPLFSVLLEGPVFPTQFTCL